MTLKIIGAGFGRTGTTSLKAALEQLGYAKCHHMTEVLTNPSQAAGFLDAWRGNPVDWDHLFDGYQATTDWPACTYYQQLMAKYPDAKVILSLRDPERWYASAYETIYPAHAVVPPWAGKLFPKLGVFREMILSQVWDGTFESRFADKDFAIKKFKAHNQEVIDTVPADKLLIFEVKQGWEPLCKFLDLPVPDTPFPHLNDKKQFKLLLMAQRILPWLLVAFLIFFTTLMIRRWLL